jgi:hypothetical protein
MARSANVPPETSRPGTPHIVAGRFRLDAPIGRGGAGVVWRGEDEVLQRPVAVKEILVPLAGAQRERDTLRARVLREARALARLNNPSIVAIYDVEEESERFWIIMELVDAESLGDVIRNHGALPPEQVAAIGLALVDALGAAHQRGVLHRDVKPGNVLLGRDGRVRLTDFGIAATEGDMTLTGTGALVGSPAYIAPERIRGSSGSPASDLWGLAATLYSAVEGTPPFEGPETYAVLSAVVEGRRRPFRDAGPLRSLLADLLDKEAEHRPDAAAIRERLRAIAGDASPVPAFVIAGPEPVAADDDGLEAVGDGAAESDSAATSTAAAGDDDPDAARSDELAGLEAVSGQSFQESRWPVPVQTEPSARGPLLVAVVAAVVVIGAAVLVTLLLTHKSSLSPGRTGSVATMSATVDSSVPLAASVSASGLPTAALTPRPAVVVHASTAPAPSGRAVVTPSLTASASPPVPTTQAPPPPTPSAAPSVSSSPTSPGSSPTPDPSACQGFFCSS